MKTVKIKRENLIPFFESISRDVEFLGPVAKGNSRVFDVIRDFSRLQLDTSRTILPPKKIMLPPSFTMFHITGDHYEPVFSHVKKRILFGVHPCDIHGLLFLDRLLLQNPVDPYYAEARKRTLIFGLSCWPDEYCFARSTHTHIADEGFDLFFNDLGSFFLVRIGSSDGDDLTRLRPDLFDPTVTNDDIQRYVRWQAERNNAYKTEIDFLAMAGLLELKYRDAFWEEYERICLACGSCSMVCPTCSCFNVVDRRILGRDPVERIRQWDSCMLQDFSLVAGGGNYRRRRSSRLKLFYTHKLEAYGGKYGKPGCVGCGRCLVTCPVGINVKTVSEALEGKGMKAASAGLIEEARV